MTTGVLIDITLSDYFTIVYSCRIDDQVCAFLLSINTISEGKQKVFVTRVYIACRSTLTKLHIYKEIYIRPFNIEYGV